jgi:hypothetical protein
MASGGRTEAHPFAHAILLRHSGGRPPVFRLSIHVCKANSPGRRPQRQTATFGAKLSLA